VVEEWFTCWGEQPTDAGELPVEALGGSFAVDGAYSSATGVFAYRGLPINLHLTYAPIETRLINLSL
jgi:hypothetical protein